MRRGGGQGREGQGVAAQRWGGCMEGKRRESGTCELGRLGTVAWQQQPHPCLPLWAPAACPPPPPPVCDVLRQVELPEGRQQPLHPLLKALGGAGVARRRHYRHMHVAAPQGGQGPGRSGESGGASAQQAAQPLSVNLSSFPPISWSTFDRAHRHGRQDTCAPPTAHPPHTGCAAHPPTHLRMSAMMCLIISLSCSMWAPSAYSVPSASKVISFRNWAEVCTCARRQAGEGGVDVAAA